MKDVCAREKTSPAVGAVKNTQLARLTKVRAAKIMLVFFVISVKNE